jgi:hypothetical protein
MGEYTVRHPDFLITCNKKNGPVSMFAACSNENEENKGAVAYAKRSSKSKYGARRRRTLCWCAGVLGEEKEHYNTALH